MDSLRTKVTKRRGRGEEDDDDEDDDDEERKRFPKKWRDGCWLMRFNIGCQSDFSLICVFLSFSSSRWKETALHHEKNISIDRADHQFIDNDEIAVVDEINALPNYSLMLITKGVRDWNAHSRTERILLLGLDSWFFSCFLSLFLAASSSSVPNVGSLYLIRHLFAWVCLSAYLPLACCSVPFASLSLCSKVKVARGKRKSTKNDAFFFDWTD